MKHTVLISVQPANRPGAIPTVIQAMNEPKLIQDLVDKLNSEGFSVINAETHISLCDSVEDAMEVAKMVRNADGHD